MFRTKSRITCLADPSFHEGNVSLDVVWADAETDKGGADKAGSNAKVESKVRGRCRSAEYSFHVLRRTTSPRAPKALLLNLIFEVVAALTLGLVKTAT